MFTLIWVFIVTTLASEFFFPGRNFITYWYILTVVAILGGFFTGIYVFGQWEEYVRILNSY